MVPDAKPPLRPFHSINRDRPIPPDRDCSTREFPLWSRASELSGSGAVRYAKHDDLGILEDLEIGENKWMNWI